MLKLMGAIFCSSAWLAAGLCRYRNEKKRLAALRSLSRTFRMMYGTLSAELSPIPELLKVASEGYAALLLEMASAGMEKIGEKKLEAIWAEALEGCPPLLAEDEKKTVKVLGGILGTASLETQLRALDTASVRLDQRAEELRCRLPELRKLSLGLSAALAALTVVLLL